MSYWINYLNGDFKEANAIDLFNNLLNYLDRLNHLDFYLLDNLNFFDDWELLNHLFDDLDGNVLDHLNLLNYLLHHLKGNILDYANFFSYFSLNFHRDL